MRAPIIRVSAALALSALAGSNASATWSIILIDTRTGEIAVGSATCLTNFDLRAGTPVLIPGVGAATAQSSVDTTGQNRVFIRDRLAQGIAPADILTQLATFDTGHQSRQYGIADALGRTATFTGSGAGQWAGGQTGQYGSIFYAIQGNVLTGSPVVEQAVQAALATPGDLAAKLMASMQAARLMGGDGRCSCSAGAPTSCGSPPPSFTKSAHIGYMLIARAGDLEGGNGIYRAGSGPVGVGVGDFNNDGRPDMVISNAGTANVSLITNQGPALFPFFPENRFPMFALTSGATAAGAGARGIAVGDVTGDMLADVAVANTNGNTVTVLAQHLMGGLMPLGTFPVGASPRAVAIGQFDGVNGSDVAAVNFIDSTVSILLSNGTGFTPGGSPSTESGPVDLAAADFTGSAAIDLAVIARTANRLTVLGGNGDGTFVTAQTVPISTGPVAIVAIDVDGDLDLDLAIATDTTPGVQILRNNGGAFTAEPLVTLPFAPVDLAAGDIDGDHDTDLVAVGTGSIARLFNNGGTFTVAPVATAQAGLGAVAIADLDGDGDLDLALPNSGVGGAMVVRNYGPGPLQGAFNSGIGCGTGDYFMNFNVAFQQTTSPDPVVQLQGLYDQWRTQLQGRPDAVQSVVTITPSYIVAGAGTATMTIAVRDWRGLPASRPISSVQVAPPSSPALLQIGPVQAQGGGVYTVVLTAGSQAGLARLRVRVDDGVRPVYLMPDPLVSLITGCYANCDGSTSPPILNVSDFICYNNRFAAGEPYANCNNSTLSPVLNVSDFICFMNRYAAGCP